MLLRGGGVKTPNYPACSARNKIKKCTEVEKHKRWARISVYKLLMTVSLRVFSVIFFLFFFFKLVKSFFV